MKEKVLTGSEAAHLAAVPEPPHPRAHSGIHPGDMSCLFVVILAVLSDAGWCFLYLPESSRARSYCVVAGATELTRWDL